MSVPPTTPLKKSHLGQGTWPPWPLVPPAVPCGSPRGLGHVFLAPQRHWGAAGTMCPPRCWHWDGLSDANLASQRASRGLKTSLNTPPGHCGPAVGTRAPAPCHSAWLLALPCRADAEMLVAPPGPRAPPRMNPAPGRLRTQPGCNSGPQTCYRARSCLPGVFSAVLCRGVSDPVCTAVPGPCGGGWKTVPRGSGCQHPLLAMGHVLPCRTQLSPPRGDTGGWLPLQFLQ